MICKYCGKGIAENTKYCPECGAAQVTGVCKVCASEIKPGMRFCPNCGRDIKSNPDNSLPTPVTPVKKKKSFYSRAWVFVVVALILFLAALFSNGGSGEPSTKETQPTISESEFKAKCVEISYTDLARNPESKKGQNFKFTGEVIQVMEYGKYVDLRVNVTPVYWNDDKTGEPMCYQDTIFVTAKLGDDGSRILERDIITIYGTCTGLHTYKTVMKSQNSIPGIKADYWEIAG